jgi:hypothetical protein
MRDDSLSEKYAILAAIALILLVAFDNALAILIGSLIGLAVGGMIARRGNVRRVALVAMAGFAVAAAIAALILVRQQFGGG